MATAGDERSISIDRGDVIGSTVISGNGNFVVLQAAGLVQDEPQDHRAADAKIGPNPYKGLLAFHEDDTERFFGREVQIDRLWQLFRDLHDPPPRGQSSLRLLAMLVGLAITCGQILRQCFLRRLGDMNLIYQIRRKQKCLRTL